MTTKDHNRNLDQSEQPRLESEPQQLAANSPRLLIDPAQGLLVLEGHLDVFAVVIVDGEPVGARTSLFRVTSGEMVFGLLSQRDEQNHQVGLLAVGVPGTRAQALDWTALDGINPVQAASLLDRFIGALLMTTEYERPPADSVVVEAGTEIELFHFQVMTSTRRRPSWVHALDVPIHLKHAGTDPLAAAPLNTAVWYSVSETTRIVAESSGAFLKRDNWQETVIGFLTVFAESLAAEVKRHALESAERQRQMGQSADFAMHSALTAMVETATSQSGSPSLDLPSADNTLGRLHAVFIYVARLQQIEQAAVIQRIPEEIHLQPMDLLATTYGVRTRPVILRDDWWQQDNGPLIGFEEASQEAVALIPDGASGYQLWKPGDVEPRQISEDDVSSLKGEATMLYRPLRRGAESLAGLFDHVSDFIQRDLWHVVGLGLLSAALSLTAPVLLGVMIDDVLPRADSDTLILIVIALVCAALGAAAFELVKAFALLRIESKADLHLQSAIFDRMLRLPVSFFRQFSSGDLADRILGIQSIRQTMSGALVQVVMGLTYAVVSLMVLFWFSWELALVGLLLVSVSVGITFRLARSQLNHERQRIRHQGYAEGFVVQFLTGISKLRIAAAEARAFSRWAGYFTRQKRHFVAAQQYANWQEVLQVVYPVFALGVIFIMTLQLAEATAYDAMLTGLVDPAGAGSVAASLGTGEFVAFITAFGQLMASLTTVTTALTMSLSVVPTYERLQPVLETPTESSQDGARQVLQGQIEVDQVTFRYGPGAPVVLQDLSLKVDANEFVAIVGPSGSGKSTLVRLLLGFETCEAGEVLLDGTPLGKLDIVDVRRQIRVVQQVSQLVTGSLFTNIVGASTLTVDDAWRAARLAGIAKDIEELPMGMHTVITEGVSTFSGGQRQRLMIARALVHQPRILLLDEPTSALDNQTQELVMQSLATVNATRIMIAHRLSTIRAADRILVMDNGRLVQQGVFEDLINVEGPFRELAQRQLM